MFSPYGQAVDHDLPTAKQKDIPVRTTLEVDMTLEGRKVLVTDDEPDEQDFIVAVLEDAGATVLKAHNGDEALELAESEQPDIVTLDINMPGMDVFQVMDALQNNGYRKDMKICIVSGRPELRRLLTDRFRAKALGFVDKPFTQEELLAKLIELTKD
jgi:CheY-like chemotaxis protein